MSRDLKNIAVLVPGGLSPHALSRIDETFRLVRIPQADPALITEELAESVRGMAVSTTIDATFINALPNLEIIANFGVGYDGVDARHAGGRGVMVTNTPDVLTEEVADTTIGLLLSTVRELPRAERWLREGSWLAHGPYPLSRTTLRGRRVGIFGMGRIGQAVAKRIEAFGLPIAYHNRRRIETVAYDYHDTLLGLATAVDTLISVAPGTPETRNAVDEKVLAALGREGVFINIGRGSTVDEEALARALAEGTIMAAGLDVFADEPNVHPALLDLPNAVLLPHIGSASIATRNAMADLVVDNLISWFGEGHALTPVPETIAVHERAARSAL